MTIELLTIVETVLVVAYAAIGFVVFHAVRFGSMDTRDGAWFPLLCAAFWPVAGVACFMFGFWAWLVGS